MIHPRHTHKCGTKNTRTCKRMLICLLWSVFCQVSKTSQDQHRPTVLYLSRPCNGADSPLGPGLFGASTWPCLFDSFSYMSWEKLPHPLRLLFLAKCLAVSFSAFSIHFLLAELSTAHVLHVSTNTQHYVGSLFSV